MFNHAWLEDHKDHIASMTAQARRLFDRWSALENADGVSVRHHSVLAGQLDKEVLTFVETLFLEGMNAGWEEYAKQARLREDLQL